MRRRHAAFRVTAALTLLASATLLPATAQGANSAVVTTNGCIASVPEPGTATPVRICYSLFQPEGASARKTVPLIFRDPNAY